MKENEMKYFTLLMVLFLSSPIYADTGDVIEIGVTGLTCAFCVDGLNRNLKKLPGVDKADVSLKNNKARIKMQSGSSLDLPAIRSAIIDAGFTPGDLLTQ